MPLTDTAVKNAKSREKQYKLADERGLYLLITPSGGKRWRLKYRFNGKEKLLAFGVYPDVSLKDARDRRDAARKLLAQGQDPSETRKSAKAERALKSANSFEAVALAWHEQGKTHGFNKGRPWTKEHADRILSRLRRDVFPDIGRKAIADISTEELRPLAKKIAARSIETAHRALSDCSGVFRYAIAHGKASTDPTESLRSAKGRQGILPPVPVRHFATITDPREVGALLRSIDSYDGTIVVRCALRLAPLVFVRPGELRNAVWNEFDFDAKEWRIPAERMKMRDPHIVPLSRQTLSILMQLKEVTGHAAFVFPGARTNGRPMSENAVNGALRALGYTSEQFTGHGFRAMATTLLNEQGWNRDAVERQLAHAERNSVRAAYNYAEYLPERRKMMQAWADYLDQLKAGKTQD